MKIFWTTTIGKKERGHVVIFLGYETRMHNGIPLKGIKIWSANFKGSFSLGGYSYLFVPFYKIKRKVFCRLQNPENIVKWLDLPQ